MPTSPEKFDLIILDPPSLAKRATERAGAIRAYERLNSQGIQTTGARRNSRGRLVFGACFSAEEFFDAVRRAAMKSGRKFYRNENHCSHPPDHPAGFKEAEYLKGIYLKFD